MEMESECMEKEIPQMRVKTEVLDIEPEHLEIEPEVVLHTEMDNEIEIKPDTNQSLENGPSELEIFKCGTCNFETEYSNCYQLHLLLHTEIQPLKPVLLDNKPKYKCNVCHLRIKSKEELRIHQQTHENTVYKCGLCGFQTENNDNYKIHLKIHTEKTDIQCPQCSFKAKNLKGLRRHQLVHIGLVVRPKNGTYQISSINKNASAEPLGFDTRRKDSSNSDAKQQNNLVSKKVQQKHGNYLLNTSEQESLESETPFKCPKCNLIVNSEEDFIEHKEMHQNPLIAEMETPSLQNESVPKCSECGLICNSTVEFSQHKNTHAKLSGSTEITKQVSLGCANISKSDCQVTSNNLIKEEIHKDQDKSPVKLFQCNLCNFQTKFKGYYRRHIQNHTKDRRYRCNDCSFQAKSFRGLNRHKIVHRSYSQICEVCGFEAKSSFDLKKHSKKHQLEQLVDEQESTLDATESELRSFETEYKAYLDNHNHKEEESFQCPSCDFKSKTLIGLKRHKSVHADPEERRRFICALCGFGSKTKGFLKRHMVTHSKQTSTMKCPLCPYETTKSNAMKKHELTHKNILEVEVFSCHMCNFKTKWSCALKRHVDGHVNEFLYKCTMCSYESKHKHAFNRHLLVHKDPSEVKMFSCSVCNFQTKRKKTLKVHLENHFTDKIYCCTVCPFKTKHKYILGRHMLVHQDKSNMEMFKCEECSFETKRKDTLKDHLIKHTLQKLETSYEVLIQ